MGQRDKISETVPIGGEDLDYHRGARRASRRFPMHAEVEVSGDREGNGVVINVSAGGLRMAVEQTLQVGDRCSLQIRTPSNSQWTETGRVVWTRQLPDGYLCGVCFDEAA